MSLSYQSFRQFLEGQWDKPQDMNKIWNDPVKIYKKMQTKIIGGKFLIKFITFTLNFMKIQYLFKC